MNIPDRPETWFMPSANPRFSRGNASVRMAAELAVSMDPPRAWTTRQPMSHCAPRVPVNGQREIETDPPEDGWQGDDHNGTVELRHELRRGRVCQHHPLVAVAGPSRVAFDHLHLLGVWH
jgi:hypothetical protein